ncbi:hypothetical protein [Streptosporangium saharense]|uniref:hypothetical protein n=1 Tax=Streptosporangium saharense TaxID=1706840 RepID=UPI0033222AF1
MTAGEPVFWTWVRTLRRAELGFGEGKKRVGSDTVQHVALVAVTYGNPDGTRIRPSVDRLARVCRKDEKTVRLCLARLREVGLFVRVFEGSSAGRGGKADEYHLGLPDDLLIRVAMLDPDERTLVVPAGVEPPPVKRSRGKKTDSSEGGSPGAAPAVLPVDNSLSPGAAPCDQPVDNPETPGAAPADTGLLASNHRVLPPGTPGAAPKNTGCSTRPPTYRPTNHLPDTYVSPYGADVEGGDEARREPSAKESSAAFRPPTLTLLPALTPDPAEYDRARDLLARLPDLGSALLGRARDELGDAPLARLVIHAAALVAPPPKEATP